MRPRGEIECLKTHTQEKSLGGMVRVGSRTVSGVEVAMREHSRRIDAELLESSDRRSTPGKWPGKSPSGGYKMSTAEMLKRKTTGVVISR